ARLRHSGRQRLLEHAAIAHGGKVVGRLPASGIVLDAQVVETALERFQMRIGLAVVIEADLVEVPEAAVDRKVAAPITGIALKRDALAGVDFADDIGTGPERRLKRSLLEGLGLDGVLCKHRHQSEDERKLAVVAAGKIEAHRLVADRFGLGDLGVVGAVIWPAFIAYKLPGEDDVLGGYRFAVGELRSGGE